MTYFSKIHDAVHNVSHQDISTTFSNARGYRSSKILLFTIAIAFSVVTNTNVIAESPCCGEKKHDSTSCSKNHKDVASISGCATSAKSTSGCAPSGCRGAKTKFGKAKVISNLRSRLISLKAEMEKSTQPTFDARSYDIHRIVGQSDDESLQIIIKEVKLIERAFAEKLNHNVSPFRLPNNKAKQISYLSNRIEDLQKIL